MFNILTYKIIATCIGRANALRANNTRVTCQYKARESVPCYSQLKNWCLAPPLRIKKPQTS